MTDKELTKIAIVELFPHTLDTNINNFSADARFEMALFIRGYKSALNENRKTASPNMNKEEFILFLKEHCELSWENSGCFYWLELKVDGETILSTNTKTITQDYSCWTR